MKRIIYTIIIFSISIVCLIPNFANSEYNYLISGPPEGEGLIKQTPIYLAFEGWSARIKGRYDSKNEEIHVNAAFFPRLKVYRPEKFKDIALFLNDKFVAIIPEKEIYTFSATGSFEKYWVNRHSHKYYCWRHFKDQCINEANDSQGQYNGMSKHFEANNKYKLIFRMLSGEVKEMEIENPAESVK